METLDDVAAYLLARAQDAVLNKRYNGLAPPNASGMLYNSLQSRVTENSIQIVVTGEAVRYVDTLTYGRGPTVNSGSGGLRQKIRIWLDNKNVGDPDDRESISYAITKVIHKEGNYIYRNGLTPTNLWSDVVDKEAVWAFASIVRSYILETSVA